MSNTWQLRNSKMEEVPDNDGFVDEEEEDEVDIDDVFEEIEEEDSDECNGFG
jgi:hypothetical protein